MTQIKMQPVESSQIKAIGWEKETMAVQFKNGDIWEYTGVYEDTYLYLKGSHSIGGTFAVLKNKLVGKKVS